MGIVRILVLETLGSAPREAGTAMLVTAEGQEGTIGGGALELMAVERAQAMLAGWPSAQEARIPLGPALGQCCGGAVRLVWERFEALPDPLPPVRPLMAEGPVPPALAARAAALPAGAAPRLENGWIIEPSASPRRPLWVWGAGHVGRAIVQVTAPLPDIAITWVDLAPELFPDPLPHGVTAIPAATPQALVARAPRDADHLILTRSHALDLELCHALLGHGFASCGLIGSATKAARFRARLTALGHGAEAIARIACPIGDPSLGRHPQAIAVGVVATLLSHGGVKQERRTG
ncbi:xanthine dehydrogenase accessory protein XdhC [Pseudoroseicyclus aestuarii]|uniref:Molybdenum cofactor sulfurylase n=1 Tax=Pseudoroseicyclus aestuarii TaxID=1795041 RepID=A0A318SYR9_9RHOB|nr:xanthine dehydrogenase accessory protein XdhC [Pseudoroseicyclus aestuarii]PYE85579.1 molybdenum cofactor sulfurylase [Pseudoroseicyclus aestuarii]